MSASLLVDELWLCLCPSFRTFSSSISTNSRRVALSRIRNHGRRAYNSRSRCGDQEVGSGKDLSSGLAPGRLGKDAVSKSLERDALKRLERCGKSVYNRGARWSSSRDALYGTRPILRSSYTNTLASNSSMKRQFATTSSARRDNPNLDSEIRPENRGRSQKQMGVMLDNLEPKPHSKSSKGAQMRNHDKKSLRPFKSKPTSSKEMDIKHFGVLKPQSEDPEEPTLLTKGPIKDDKRLPLGRRLSKIPIAYEKEKRSEAKERKEEKARRAIQLSSFYTPGSFNRPGLDVSEDLEEEEEQNSRAEYMNEDEEPLNLATSYTEVVSRMKKLHLQFTETQKELETPIEEDLGIAKPSLDPEEQLKPNLMSESLLEDTYVAHMEEVPSESEKTQQERRKIFNQMHQPISLPDYLKKRGDPSRSIRSYFKHMPIEEFDIDALYQGLRSFAAAGRLAETYELLEMLIFDRGESPNVQLYGAMILVNVDHVTGSAGRVQDVLNEMREEGLEPGVAIFQDILRVLAVHPEPNLRSHVLESMQKRWISVTSENWLSIIAGYIKQGEVELALEALQELRTTDVKPPPWLYDMIIYKLVQMDEIDAACDMLKHCITIGHGDHSLLSWYAVFDAACNSANYEVINFIWRRRIAPRDIKPTVGHCNAVLTAAARTIDVELAVDAFRELGAQKVKLGAHHYELLAEAYVRAEDLAASLTVYCIMSNAGVTVTELSARALCTALIDGPTSQIHDAFAIIADLHTHEDRRVPVAVYNVLLEACARCLGLDVTFNYYKHLHMRCEPGRPTTTTFNILLIACGDARDARKARSIAAEMTALGISPDTLTYDRLILVFLKSIESAPSSSSGSPRSSSNLSPSQSGTTNDSSSTSTATSAQSNTNDAGSSQANSKSDPNVDPEIYLKHGIPAPPPLTRPQLLDFAMQYFEEMRGYDMLPRYKTAAMLVHALGSAGDARAKDVLTHCERHGLWMKKTARWLDEISMDD